MKYLNNLWFKRNQINGNIDYISKLLQFNNIKNWKKTINTDDTFDLFFNFQNKNYKIKVQENSLLLYKYDEDTHYNSNNPIFDIVKFAGDNGNFYGDDAWYNLFKYIRGENI